MSQMPPHVPDPQRVPFSHDPAAGDGGGARPSRRTGGLLLAVILLVVALAAASTVAVVQSSRIADQRERVALLQDRAAEAEQREQQLRAELDQAQVADDPLGALGELFGEGGLEGLLGEGGLEDLLGDLGGTPEEDVPSGGLDGLFGEDGLGGLFGDTGASPDVTACITDLPDLPFVSATTLVDQVAETTAAVEALRGHDFPEPLNVELMTSAQIEEYFRTYLSEEYEPADAEVDRLMLGLLGAIPLDIDLLEMQIGLLGDQVAGFYNGDTGEMVVRADDPDAALGATGLIVLAHELEHALVDAAVGLPDLQALGGDEDGAVAALSVVEGSAVTLQSQFQTTSVSPMALLGDLGAILGAEDGLDQVPPFIRDSLLFPYIAGPTYVCGLHAEGGWDAVDAAILTPPSTTHEVMFPTGQPLVPEPVATPEGPDGHDLVEQRTFGAAQLSWLFASPGGEEALAPADPVGATESWRGGELSLWTRDGETAPGSADGAAVSLVLAGADLCGPVTMWWEAAAGGDRDVLAEDAEQVVQATGEGTWGVVRCDGGDIRVGIAATADLARDAIS